MVLFIFQMSDNKRKLFHICAVVFALFISVPTAFSADIISLFNLARDADPALQSVQYDGKIADELHHQSIANFLPNVTGQYQAQRTRQKILRSDNAVFGQGKSIFPTTNLTATLTQPVFHADAWYDFSKTKLGEIKSKLDYAAAEQDLMARLIDAYLKTLASEQDNKLAVSELSMLQKELKTAHIKYDNGLLAVSELRDVQARTAEVEAKLAATRAAVRDSREVLRGMVGVPIDQLHTLPRNALLPEIDPKPVDERVKQALVNNYTIRSHRAAVEIASKESSRLYAQHVPTVDLIARFNRRDTQGSLFGGGSKVDTGDVILQVDVPIFSGGRMQSRAREAVYRWEQSKQDLEATHRSVERDIRSGYANLLSDKEKIASLEHVLAAKRSLYELKKEGYRSGVNSIQAQMEAQRDFYSAERDLAAARYDHLFNYIKIRKASGTLASSDLMKINRLLTDESKASTTYDLATVGAGAAKANTDEIPLVMLNSAPVQPIVPQIKKASEEPVDVEPANPRLSKTIVVVASALADKVSGSVDSSKFTVQPAVTTATVSNQLQTVAESLEYWRQSWESRDPERYFSCYAPSFRPASGSIGAWKITKRHNLGNKKFIRIVLNNVEVKNIATGKKVSLRQFYHSDSYNSEDVKTLKMEQHDNRWLIVSEVTD